MQTEQTAILAIYFSILVWSVVIVALILQLRGQVLHEDVPNVDASVSTKPSWIDMQDPSLEDDCYETWVWRGSKISARKTATYRLIFAIGTGTMTLCTVIWRMFRLGVVRGLAEQFCYLTQWGIMLSTVYYSLAYLHFAMRNRVPFATFVFSASRRNLVRVHALALCFLISIFIMWLLVALDANIHQHLLCPALMLAEFVLNRIPVRKDDLLILVMTLALYILVNFAATYYWFPVYPGVITYRDNVTAVYIALTTCIACGALLVCSSMRQRQLEALVMLDVSIPNSEAAELGFSYSARASQSGRYFTIG